MNDDDMYSIESWLVYKELDAHIKGDLEKKAVYTEVLSKIRAMRDNQWPHVK
jgi:hypothetical protein